MDVFVTRYGLRFAWDSEKAASNEGKHGVSFDQACETFFDQFVQYFDASVEDEIRTAAIGLDFLRRLLFVVHLEREPDCIRIVSARFATAGERRIYEDNS